MRPDHYFTLYKKMNSKWIKDLDVRPETIRVLEENVGGTLLNIRFGVEFMDVTAKAKTMKARIKTGTTSN